MSNEKHIFSSLNFDNAAARLEGLAEPGGICISDAVFQSVAERFSESFRDMGSQRVKNIARAIRVWQWTPEAARGCSKTCSKMSDVIQCLKNEKWCQSFIFQSILLK